MHNHLQQALVIYGREDSSVRIDRYFSAGDLGVSSRWRTNANNQVDRISVSLTENEHSPRNTLADSLDLECMSRIMGCHTASQLWPGAPNATEPW